MLGGFPVIVLLDVSLGTFNTCSLTARDSSTLHLGKAAAKLPVQTRVVARLGGEG